MLLIEYFNSPNNSVVEPSTKKYKKVRDFFRFFFVYTVCSLTKTMELCTNTYPAVFRAAYTHPSVCTGDSKVPVTAKYGSKLFGALPEAHAKGVSQKNN